MTDDTIHTCSYSCERPECIRAQRDELVARLTAAQQPADGEEIMVNTPYDVFILPLRPSGLSSGPRFVVHVPGPEAQAQDGGEAEPPNAPVGADFAAVASILRRAMRDGAHYSYKRRDFILQQAMALEALATKHKEPTT